MISAPLPPMIPSACPGFTSKERSRSAQNCWRGVRPGRHCCETDQPAAERGKQVAQAVVKLDAAETLGDVVDTDEPGAFGRHTYSANANSARWKSTAATARPPRAHSPEYARYQGAHVTTSTPCRFMTM